MKPEIYLIRLKNSILNRAGLLLLLSAIFFSTGYSYAQTTWYSYQSGDWDQWRTWTMDPSGTTLINPSNTTPSSAVNNTVVILNGRTVTIRPTVTTITTLGFTIQEGAVLDLTTNTYAHSFGVFSGSGMLRLSTSVFPTFASGSFVQAGGGTVEYRGMAGFTLAQFTYNNLIINLNNNADEVLYNNNTALTINGNFTIEKGILRIGNNVNTTPRIVNFNGDVTVNANGQIGVGNNTFGNSTSGTPANRSHQITIRGNLINNGGTVKFTNMTNPVYAGAPPTSPLSEEGWSDVIFNNGSADQYVVCNGTTVFYRIQVAKGTDQTYVLHIDADAAGNFKLQGRNDRQDSYDPTDFGADAPNISNLNALGLLSGTCRLGNNISLDAIASEYYVLDEDVCLWLDGSQVRFYTVTQNRGIYLYGKLKLTNNALLNMDDATASFRRGIVTREVSSIIVDNSTLLVPIIRTSSLNAWHRGAFMVSGNSTVTLSGNTSHGYHATLSFGYPDNVISISGGTININNPTSAVTDMSSGSSGTYFSLLFGSLAKNINITGGTFNINVPAGSNAYINSTVPFYNLNVTSNNSANDLRVVQYTNPGTTSAPPTLLPQPLIVLNNLSLAGNAVLNTTIPATDVNVTVGNDFTLAGTGRYIPGVNTTTFNGTDAQTFDIQGTITGNLNNLTIDNTSSLTLSNAVVSNPVVVNADFRLNHGCTFIDNGRILEVQGNIINSGTHFKPVSGAGSIQLTGAGAQTISGDGTGTFNNLTLNKTGGSVTLLAGTTVTGDLRLANAAARLNIGMYNLKLTATGDVFDNLTGTGRTFDAGRMIRTNGLMSDGGVSKVYTGTSAFLFPVGFSNAAGTLFYYMPASIRYSSAPASYGTVTTRPVNSRHPLAQTTNSLACYWKTESTGFTGVPAGSVVHNYTYGPLTNDFVSGTESNYIPAVYRGNDATAWTTINNALLVNDGTNEVTYDTAYTANGEYTAGEPAAFTGMAIRYSTGVNGDWKNTATWSSVGVGGAGGASIPDANTIVVIGDATHNHTVTINEDGKLCGSLTIFNGSVLDLKNYIGHNFEALPDKGINGTGTLRIARTNYFPAGDFGDFIGENGGTVEYYTIGGADVAVPLISDITGLTLDHYYNLKLSPAAGRTITLPNSNMLIYKDLTKADAGTAYTNNVAVHTLEVNHDVNILAGVFEFQNTQVQTMKIYGNLNVTGTFRAGTGGTVVNHVLELYRDLAGTGTFDANNTGRILVYFKGLNNASITGTGTKDFYSMEVNKGTDQTPVLKVKATLTTAFDPAVTLKNGTLRIMQGNLALSGGRSFVIPVTGCLSIDSVAVVTVSNNNVDSTLYLIGKLEVLGGTMNIGNPNNTRRNSIEYSSEGNPEIVVNGGILNVNGQIKRSSLTTFGALDYRQQNGIVNIYGESLDNTRGKFEICNDNSYFGFSGGIINLYDGGGVTFGDVYLRPADAAVTSGGTLAFLPRDLSPNQTFTVDASCNLGNMLIDGLDNNDSAVVKLMVNPLVLQGNLTINDTYSRLFSNNLNVTIAGNFTNNGKYTAGTNITTFNGGNTQSATLGVNTVFNKLVVDKSGGSAVTFTSGGAFQPTVNDSLTINSGVLVNAGTLNIIARGNIINNGIHSSTGTGSLLVQGTRNQVIAGNNSGQFGNLTIANGAANGITLTANTTVNGVLTLTSGYFYINDFLLTLSSTASIGGTPGVPANRNWIVSNGVLSDAGIRKNYPAVSPSSFTFPVGVVGKYTPVSYAVTFTAASPGSITIRPVNIKMPSLTNALVDELQYYWNVSSTPFGGMSAVTRTFTYLQGDVQGNEGSYVGARYYGNTWTNLGAGVLDIGNNIMTISQNYIDGEYTCGEPGNFLTKDVYYSYDLAPGITTLTGADWNLAGSWATGSHAGPVATIPPDGNPMVIKAGHRVFVNNDDRMAYSIVNDGTLDLKSTVGHSMGHVSGNGRIIMNNTTAGQFVFPGGNYTEFMNTSGSTIEYYGTGGPITSSISPIIRTYQNLEFTGPGNKNMSCVDILVRGNLLITGSQLINTEYDKDIVLWGNWVDQISQGFVPGTGKVSFEGTALQTITSPNPEHFYNFSINNAAGLDLIGPTEIANRLTLTNGIINTTETDLLTLTNTNPNIITGGSDASFVDGPLSKRIFTGQSFNFPVGNVNGPATKPIRYGNIVLSEVSTTNYWIARYVNASPDNGGWLRTSLLSPLTEVSDNEYWVVTRPAGNTANVKLRWDDASNIASVNTTRVTEWVTPAGRWEEKGSVLSGLFDAGTVSTSTPVSTDNFVFTLGTSGVTARITNVSPASICNNGEVVTVTVTLTGSPNWTLTYSAGSNTYTQSGITSGTYNIQLTGADFGGAGTHDVKLTAVSDATKTGTVDNTVYPVTVKSTFIPDIQGTFTVGAGEIRNYNTTGNAGSTFAWTWQGTDGGTIATPAAAATDITIATPGSFPATYQLMVTETSSNGCVASDIQSITVLNVPTPAISPDGANQCLGNIVTYSTPSITGHTYAWAVVGGTPASGTGNSIAVTWNATGNGSVMVTEYNGPLTGTDIVNVVVDPQPNIGLVVTGPASVCDGSIASISIAGSQSGFSYQLREGAINIGSAVAGTGGNISLPSGIMNADATFNVLAYNNGCSAQLTQTVTVTVNNPAAPTGTATQSFCAVDNPTVANLMATGTAIKWYTTSTGGTALATTTALSTGAYYASQTIGACESALRFAVTVTVDNPAAPTGTATQSFCAIDNPTVANLTATGTAIKWYSAATGGTALATTTALSSGTYYASQTVGTCESALRFAVTVTVNNPAAPTGTAAQSFCAIDNPTVANLAATGTSIKWYTTSTGGTALATTTALSSGTYYASQTIGTCESALRFAVTVTVNNPAAPTGTATQSFCAIDNPTVVNLMATGTAIKWYTTSTGGTALATTTALSTGTYYASQTVGTCESALRFAVAVTVNNPAAPTGTAAQSFCAIDNPTVANLNATGTAIKWYTTSTGGTALATTTALSSGTYYASQTVGTCESALRFAVAVTVNNPAAPTGTAAQSFCAIDNPTVANLAATGTAIKWYTTSTGGTALATTTALSSGTYYASQTVGTCESALRFAVTVTVDNPAAPSGSATQSFCAIDNPTVANLNATGTAIKWYSAATGGTALATTTALSTGNYYASQTIGTCESALRFAVAVTVNNPAAPSGSATQSFCAIDNPTVANLNATGTAIKWYSAATGGTALATTTALSSGTYYASQTVGTCESALRFAVAVTVNNPAAPTGTATQSFCAIDNPTVANLMATGTAIKWYTTSTGGTALATTTALSSGTYYASQTVGTCESALRFAVTVTVNNPAAPTGTAAQSFCAIDNPTVANLAATGTAIKWYTTSTGGTALATTTALSSGTYYASQTVGTCESALRFAVTVTVNNPAAPTGTAAQSFCAIDNPTVANLAATGTSIKWYTTSTGGTALATTTALSSGTYYASQTIGTCESALRFAVAVTVDNPAAPTGTAAQSFCAIDNPTVANLNATGTAIKWYTTSTGGTALATTTGLSTGNYYASQTIGTCESALRFAVAVTVNDPAAPTGTATQSFCAIDNPTVANLAATGTAIKWYTTSTGGTALATTTALSSGTYYASQTVGTCESALRFAVTVTVNNPAAPTGTVTQSFCAIDNPTVANLTATGTAIKWYTTSTGGTALATTTALSSGTYYASQTVGTCESALRFPVAVTVNNPAAPTGTVAQSFCAIDNPTVANLNATGTAIKWYTTATGGTALATTTALSTGTYYASQTVGTCESALRFAVTVTVNIPAAPTGTAAQSFCAIDNPTVANLTATGTGIKWYSAATGGTALATTTALSPGTYYASQTVGTCESALRFAVTVTVNDPAAPTGTATQSFCTIDNPTVANLTATGAAIKWYTTSTGGTSLATTTALSTGTYYASQTVGTCESALRFAVAVTVNNPAAPSGSATQSFCAIDNPTVANLAATGTAIKWYSVATGGTALATTTALSSGTYYASQTIGTCESALRFAVAVTVNDPAAPTGTAAQSFCAIDNPTVANLAATGTAIKWYTTSTGGTALATTTALSNGTYYASQTVGTCESALRFAVTVTVNIPAAPTGSAAQSFCAIDNPTVANLTATGTGIKWYSAATGGTALATTTALSTGAYYASQTVGTCESALRFAVAVTVDNPAAPTGTAEQSFCAVDNPTVANLTVTGTGIKWYSDATGGTSLATTMALSTGTYYASQTIGSCESALRFAVTVTVNFATAPAGAATQDFCAVDNPTVANLTATGTAIKWYPAATGGTALATTTALSSGTYYASQTIGTCESDSRLAVTVSVNADPVTSGINGDNAPLCMSTGVTYSVVPTAGSTYAWTVPADANIASGGSGPVITVDFGSESGLITVTETSATGCQGDPVQLAIDLQGCALHAGFSADPTAICLGENVVFTDTSEGTNAGTLYAWDFGEGAAPATANTAGPHTVMYTTPGAKTVSLTISNGISSTITQDNYITVNAVPVVALEGADRCGPGTVDFTATLTDGDQVDFSLDNGTSIISSVSAPPYVYTATLGANSSIQVSARAYNTVTGCYGTWNTPAVGRSFIIPVTEKIASANIISPVEGYVDIVCSGKPDALYYVNGDPQSTYNWNIPALGITLENATQIEVDWTVPGGDYVIELQRISGDGCAGNISDTLVMVAKPEPDLGGEISLCEGETHTFTLAEEYAVYRWQDNSSASTYTTSASEKVYVEVFDAYGCSGSDTAMVTLYNNPVVDLGADTVICGANSLRLDAGNFVSYDWSTGETGNPVTLYEGAGTVSVTVTDEHGCQDSDEIVIRECDPETLLGVIPNTFTPNGDQIHDTWEIKKIYLFPDASIKVYDRWGRLVFEADGGYNNNWNGTGPNGKDLPVDTYYYIIDLKVDGFDPFTGTVSIIR